jgi:hypothetical protein
MDYSRDQCMNIFTRNQISRMHIVLENSPRRKTLVNSPVINREEDITEVDDDLNEVRAYHHSRQPKRLTI